MVGPAFGCGQHPKAGRNTQQVSMCVCVFVFERNRKKCVWEIVKVNIPNLSTFTKCQWELFTFSQFLYKLRCKFSKADLVDCDDIVRKQIFGLQTA